MREGKKRERERELRKKTININWYKNHENLERDEILERDHCLLLGE